MKNYEELFIAKLAAILDTLWGITDSAVILKVAEKYIKYKQSTNLTLEKYLDNKLSVDIPLSWYKAIEVHNIFYSYCFGLFKLVPLTFFTAGYPVAILVSDSLRSRQSPYFEKLRERRLPWNNQSITFKLIGHKDSNLFFKIKSLISQGYKIIFFVDGNKGIENTQKNLLNIQFKRTNIMFHQGFGMINYLYKSNILNGLCITNNADKIIGEHFVDHINSSLIKLDYIPSIINTVVKNLDTLIQPESVHQWDALLSIYKWKNNNNELDTFKQPVTKKFYTSFSISKNEFYILNHKSFMVFPTDEKTYNKLKISP